MRLQQKHRRRSVIAHGPNALRLLVLGIGLAACTENPVMAARATAVIPVHSITPATVRSLAIEVSGPGIEPSVLVNIPVDTNNVASGSLEVAAGSGRRFIITAVDTSGAPTHRGDTTLTLVPGPNPPLSLTLRALSATVGITVTFADARSPKDVRLP